MVGTKGGVIRDGVERMVKKEVVIKEGEGESMVRKEGMIRGRRERIKGKRERCQIMEWKYD